MEKMRRLNTVQNSFLLILSFGLLLQSSARVFAEADGPDFYAVKGVDSEDVLNIREEADHRATKIGTIPPDATCLRNLGCVGGLTFEEFTTLSEAEKRKIEQQRPRWCKVEYNGVTGWVAGRYLQESADPCLTTQGTWKKSE